MVQRYITAALVVILMYPVAREWIGMIRLHYEWYDYAFFYYAFQCILHHQVHNLYNLHNQMVWFAQFNYPRDPHNQYVYPPQFAVLFGWLGWLPFRVSAVVWMVGSVGSYFVALWCLVRLLWPGTILKRVHLLTLCLTAILVTPFEIDVIAGNVNNLLFFTVCISYYLLYGKNSPRLAGIPLGLAILFKVTPAAVLLIFVLKRQWRVCVWTCITVIVGTVITFAVVGVGPVFQYVCDFSSFGHNSMKNGPAPYNQSIVGVVGLLQQHGWLFGGKWAQDISYIGFTVWVLRGIWKHVPHADDWRLDVAIGSMCPLLFSPLVEEMHLLYVVPALMVLIRVANEARFVYNHGQMKSKYPVVVAVTSLGLLSLPVTFSLNYVSNHWPMLAWTHIQMFVVLVLVYSAVIRLYRSAGYKEQQLQRVPW